MIGNIFTGIGRLFSGNRGQQFSSDVGYAERASIDDMMYALKDDYGEIRPDYPMQIVEIFKLLAFINPDVSQAVQKFIHLGNKGHSVEITGSSERVKDEALGELNRLSRNAFGNSAGADGFINKQFRQIAITGALCQELNINQGFTGVKEIYQVKASSIRFRLEDNSFVPFQQIGLKNIELNPRTFSYIPLMSDEGSPYALPPFSGALRYILRQEKQWGEIDRYTEIWGMLNYVHMTVKNSRDFNELPSEYSRRLSQDMERYRDMYISKRKNGIAVTGNNVEMKDMGIRKNVGGLDSVIQNTETMIASGMDIDPAMLGRSYSTTETYATVCYETLCGKLENIQRLIKRGNEVGYNYHLMLSRIPAQCSLKFKSPPSLKRKEAIEADEIKQRMIFERMSRGIISADDAARELGYEKAYRNDTGNERVSFDFDRSLNKYVFNRPTVVASLAKKKRRKTMESYEADYASRFFEILDVKFSEILDEVEECLHEDEPVDALMDMVREKLEIELGDETEKLSREINSEVYFQELRNKVAVSRHSVSFAAGVDFDGDNGEWKVTDQTAIDWFVKSDKFFFSKQYSHYMDDLKEVVVNELKGVEKAYSKAVVDRMREKMGAAFEHPTVKNYYDLVIRNAVNRSRNYARAYKFQRAGIAEMEVVAIIDRKTSAICREMNGRRISTETAVEYVNKTIESPLDELTEKFAWPTPRDVQEFRGKSTAEILEKLSCKLPPYHGRCRTTTVMSMRTRVTNSSGTTLNDFKKPKFKGMPNAVVLKNRLNNEKRLEEYKNLTIDEWSSKINASQGAQWDRDNLNKHFDDHLNDFAKISTLSFVKTEDEYEKFSKKLLADFNRVFIYMENDGNRLMFYNKELNSVVIVDSSTNGIVSCYPLKQGMKQKYVNKYMELINGKEEYN